MAVSNRVVCVFAPCDEVFAPCDEVLDVLDVLDVCQVVGRSPKGCMGLVSGLFDGASKLQGRCQGDSLLF